jgi:hypothetical protein
LGEEHRDQSLRALRVIRKRQETIENDAKPVNQSPGCRDDNIAPNTRDAGTIQGRSVFVIFMREDFTLLARAITTAAK